MTDDFDEPLEGDIGPASAAEHTRGGTDPRTGTGTGTANGREALRDAGAVSEAEELRRYEREREERRRRTNAVSGRVALAAVALFLAFLAYDSAATAVEARRRDDPWIYPPAVVAGICLAGLAVLAAWTLRRRRR
ncbi:hypothetical protein GCM10023085_79140 [Actinomadura viridis]|uniref:Uncharacterized protein n=1 Tax=Actinomadura viridis TaxID=58110 RepID=A0A931GN66_9ACTN|nr:hypothetical protein [Actinomadura viridis]MBG6093437.1 hypothetical protein [Actinomadura viridis]